MGMKLGLSYEGKNIDMRVFENRVLRRIFELKKEKVAGGWRRLHIEELHNLYASPNIKRVITSRRMSCVDHLTFMRKRRNAYKIFEQ
jgi:hypothetical protein